MKIASGMKKRGLAPPRSELLLYGGLIAGIVLGVVWFSVVLSFPNVYRGRVCCDSTTYISIANGIHSLRDVVTQAGYRTVGYPLFLSLNRMAFGWLSDWLDAAAWVEIVLFMAVGFAWFRLLRKTKKFSDTVLGLSFFLILSMPALVAFAALPLTDTYATVALYASFGLLVFAHRDSRRGVISIAGIFHGALLALVPLSRPPLLFPVLLFYALWASAFWRKPKLYLFFLSAFTFVLCLFPRTYYCSTYEHRLCFIPTNDQRHFVHMGAYWGNRGARTYGVLKDIDPFDGYQYTLPDTFFNRFAACDLDGSAPVLSQMKCLAANAPLVPVYVLKKTIAFFDQNHMHSYAGFITTPHTAFWYRIYSASSFVGFFVFLSVVPGQWKRQRHLFAASMLLLSYYGLTILLHIESRFAFPLVPVALFCCTWGIEDMLKHKRYVLLTICALLAVGFFAQIYYWDSYDPLFLTPMVRPDPVWQW